MGGKTLCEKPGMITGPSSYNIGALFFVCFLLKEPVLGLGDG